MEGSSLKSSVSIPAHMSYLEPLEGFVRGICSVAGCDQRDSSMVSLAVEEAVSNVIRHGYGEDCSESFQVRFEVGAAGITVEVHEKGLPFDPEYLSAPQEGDLRERGIGIRLMRGAMDRVEFRNLGKDGKLVSMTKYFRHRRVDSYFSHQELSSPDETAVKGPFTVRPMEDSEALEISRCAYRAYGYTYREFVYYPERIKEMNHQGIMRSFVAEDSLGTLVGHLALSFSEVGASIAELAAAFVNPSCRGQGILGIMNEVVMAEAERSGLQGLFVHAVTSHVASQRGALKSGFVPSGVLLGALFSDLNFKALAGEVKQRESASLMYLPLCVRSGYDIWIPEVYAEVVQSILSWCDLKVSINTDSPSLPDRCPGGGEGNRSYRVGEFNFAEIRVCRFGLDSLAEVRQRTGQFRAERVDVIYLYLDAEVPDCAAFAQECRSMGYLFCGYLPGEMGGHDALILQSPETALDLNKVVLADDRGKDLLAFISKEIKEKEESL